MITSVPETVQITSDVNAVVVPKTTAEDNRKTAGQRRVNILWEFTQAGAAVGMISLKTYMVIKRLEDKTVDAALMTILGMYFSRTNHTKIGGVGGTDSR